MEFLRRLTPIQSIALVLVGILSVAMLIFLSVRLTATPLAILYSNLSPEDTATVTSRLAAQNIEFKISDNGKNILAPVGRISQLRMTFAEEGVPKSGSLIGYEIFDKNDSLGTSQFINNVNLIRALEGELARTIGSLSNVESARVHLVLPKKELFARGNTETSASVMLRIKGGIDINKLEVAGIAHLVSTAVPGLKVDNITILDQKGRPLKLSTSEESMKADANEGVAEYQDAIEHKLEDTIEKLIEKSVGVDKVKVSVSAEINFDREVTNSEVYDPNGQVLRSRKVVEESDTESEGGAGQLSVTSNLSTNAQPSKNKVRTDELDNYEISKTITNKITETGRIKKLSIAILVDGIYKVDPNAKPDDKGTPSKPVYSPRSDDELQKLKTLAASAVGLNSDRGDVIEIINMQFTTEESAVVEDGSGFGDLIGNLENVIRTIIIGIVIALTIMLIIRPIIFKMLEARQERQTELQEAISNLQDEIATPEPPKHIMDNESLPELIDLSAPNDRRKQSLVKQLNEIIDKHPEETVAILRNWMYSNER